LTKNVLGASFNNYKTFQSLSSLATTEAEDQVKSGLLLDVVVGESTAVFKLLSGEDEALLIWGDTFLVLNFGLHVLNGVGGFDVQSDGLASEGLDEDLHTSTKSEDQVKS
jgi:hypothetical protein